MSALFPSIALLRGINVGGHNLVPMAGLRTCCEQAGWEDVKTYIQSGNLVFRAAGSTAELEAALEGILKQHFGLSIEVLVRRGEDWRALLQGNPFPEAAENQPKQLLLALSKRPPRADAAARIQERAADGERILQVGDALWIHYAGGMGRSKLSPALLDRLAGSPVTGRNWNTALKIREMLEASGRPAPPPPA